MNYNFKELEDTVEILRNIMRCMRPGKINKSCLKFSEIIDEFIKQGEKHPYFKLMSPLHVELNATSQARAITIKPEHKVAMQTNILNTEKIRVPLILFEYSSSSSSGKKAYVADGVHRHTVSDEFVRSGDLPEDFKYPAMVIPSSMVPEVLPALEEMQNSINQLDPKEPNGENDLQKYMQSYCNRQQLDLNNKKDYDELVEVTKCMYRSLKPSTIKSNATRLKGKINQARSDVFATTPKEYLEITEKQLPLGKNEKRQFTSNKGSTFDQRCIRDAKYKYNNPSQSISWVFASQDNKGDSQTTINERQTFFKEIYNTWLVFGDTVLPDKVIIFPQNLSSFEARVRENLVLTEPEHRDVVSSFKIIGRGELKKKFEKMKTQKCSYPYEEKWIITKKKDVKGDLIKFPKNI